MKFTKIKSFILSLLVTAWVPVVVLFLNPGWYSFILVQSRFWYIDALLALPLIAPIANLHFRSKVLPRVDSWLQIVMYISWFLMGCLFINEGDTEESVGSLFTKLLVGSFDRHILNVVSSYAWMGMFVVSIALIIVVVIRAVIDRINYTNEKRATQGKGVTRGLVVVGITAALLSVLVSLVSSYLLSSSPLFRQSAELGSVVNFSMTTIAIFFLGSVMLRGIKRRYAVATSAISTALIALLIVGVALAFDHFAGNPFYISIKEQGSASILTYIREYTLLLDAALISPFVFWGCGALMTKNRSKWIGIIAILIGLSLSVGAVGLQYVVIHQEVDESLKLAKQAFYDSVDYKVYDLSYIPGNLSLFSRHFYSSSSGEGTQLSMEYSNYRANQDYHDFSSLTVEEYNKSKLPQEKDPNCGPTASLYSGEEFICQFVGTSHEGGRVYLVQAKGVTSILAVSITIGKTRVFLKTSSVPGFNTDQALKIANGLQEASVDSLTTIEPDYGR